mmetsp:Transcript_2378/g.3639  ORF Transcript_2378/g.3639 Transcript_2378/m.3639 type:complete len:664 (-) Transcript_2378:74-2065(-)
MSRSYGPLKYSVHCLSNGSEYTDPILLLTIERGPSSVLKRYALAGLSSLASRLAADQKIPLHTICATFYSHRGLAPLLLSLSQAGVADLTICDGNNVEAIDTIVKLTLGQRSYPVVRTCELPRKDEGINQWYLVFEDEFVMAHAKRCYGGDETVWIYTMLKTEEKPVSVGFTGAKQIDYKSFFEPLPEAASVLDGMICLSSQSYHILKKSMGHTRVYYVEPSGADDSILLRATRQGHFLARQLPFAFFFRPSNNDQHQIIQNENELKTCSKLCLQSWSVDYETHKATILSKCGKYAHKKISLDSLDILDELRKLWGMTVTLRDDNEINIDDDCDGDADFLDFPRVPHLLCLGTGASKPSTMRGSSGYAIFTPSISCNKLLCLTAIVDCGDGILTSLNRYLPPSLGPIETQLLHISFIWISHSHLDHYGGLPDLLLAIHEAKTRKSHQSKKCRLSDDIVPVIVAPTHVLRFLGASLASGHQIRYRGLTHREFEESPLVQDIRERIYRTCGFIRSVPVEHCAHAHALFWDFPDGFRLCYSGDTRPCFNLIRGATLTTSTEKDSSDNISLLLHEATFDDDERGKKEALKKKHSTVLEALNVGRKMRAKACLLSHFSQRYPKAPPGCNSCTNVAYAMDGLWFPLVESVVEKLPALSALVNQLLYENE